MEEFKKAVEQLPDDLRNRWIDRWVGGQVTSARPGGQPSWEADGESVTLVVGALVDQPGQPLRLYFLGHEQVSAGEEADR